MEFCAPGPHHLRQAEMAQREERDTAPRAPCHGIPVNLSSFHKLGECPFAQKPEAKDLRCLGSLDDCLPRKPFGETGRGGF